jgi:hypothetical protein
MAAECPQFPPYRRVSLSGFTTPFCPPVFPSPGFPRTGLFIPELKELLVAVPKKGDREAAVQVYQIQ